MVLPHSTSFIAVIVASILCFPFTSEAQTTQRASSPSAGGVLRYGLGLVTFPQQLQLKTSDDRTIDVASAQTGPLLSIDYEKRNGRWVYLGSVGASYLNMKNTSQDDSVAYSVGKDYLSYLASGGVHYITANSVKLGTSFWAFYNNFDLPTPTSPGVTYSFDYGSPIKSFISVDLNWQIFRGWLLSQSLLSPLSKDMQTGWIISLKVRF